MRSRVQQIMGATNSTQQHSGNVLPPPADDYYNNSSASSGKPNSSCSSKISPPSSSFGRSVALPTGASWGSPSNNQPTSSVPASNGPQKLKPDTNNGSVTFSTVLASSDHILSSYSDVGKKLVSGEENDTAQVKMKMMPEPVEQNLKSVDCQTSVFDTSITSGHLITTSISSNLYGLSASRIKMNMSFCLLKAPTLMMTCQNLLDVSQGKIQKMTCLNKLRIYPLICCR
ncbi:hypothetical protein ACH5RR_009960 [Cinchona calisaya]|uniref:Uncharacterized protein n=1 Tax=Cinchona calisaya TaxID=153742 RepID=A0ABD3AGF8_9GENT